MSYDAVAKPRKSMMGARGGILYRLGGQDGKMANVSCDFRVLQINRKATLDLRGHPVLPSSRMRRFPVEGMFSFGFVSFAQFFVCLTVFRRSIPPRLETATRLEKRSGQSQEHLGLPAASEAVFTDRRDRCRPRFPRGGVEGRERADQGPVRGRSGHGLRRVGGWVRGLPV